jgi:hypothetical protein
MKSRVPECLLAGVVVLLLFPLGNRQEAQGQKQAKAPQYEYKAVGVELAKVLTWQAVGRTVTTAVQNEVNTGWEYVGAVPVNHQPMGMGGACLLFRRLKK